MIAAGLAWRPWRAYWALGWLVGVLFGYFLARGWMLGVAAVGVLTFTGMPQAIAHRLARRSGASR